MITGLDRAAVAESVKRVVIAESRLSLQPADIDDHELLNGEILRVNSFGFVGMLVLLEEELDIVLPDELFVGRSFNSVHDLIEVVSLGAEASR